MIGCRGTVLYDYKTEPQLVKGLLTLSLSKKIYECKYKEKKTGVQTLSFGSTCVRIWWSSLAGETQKRCDNWEQRKVGAAWSDGGRAAGEKENRKKWGRGECEHLWGGVLIKKWLRGPAAWHWFVLKSKAQPSTGSVSSSPCQSQQPHASHTGLFNSQQVKPPRYFSLLFL